MLAVLEGLEGLEGQVVGMELEMQEASKAAVKVVEGGKEQAGAQGEGARRGGAGPGRG